MSHELAPADVKRMARLARLALTPDEERLFAGQLTRVLDFASQIAELDTTGVPPSSQVFSPEPVERPDQARPSLAPAVALGNAPSTASHLFVVPRVPGHE